MELPAQFGKYRLEKFLGGGMSHVYSATDTVLQRPVAVKILTEDGCRDHDAKRRFLLEAQMCAGITHDNIIRVHDYGEQNGRPYIVMELLTGEDLRSAIEHNHTGDLPSKLRIALQAARALEHIHGLKIVHRDIKPDNLHIDRSGRVRLMDFGIAKTADLQLTRTGFAVGTPFYMSPEQVMGKPTTASVDIYSFGMVLYEMLTASKAVSGETLQTVFYKILEQKLDLAPLEKEGIPQPLIDLVSRCAAKQPEDRPASFGAIAGEIEALLSRIDPNWVRTTGPANLPPPLTQSPQNAASPTPAPDKRWIAMAAGGVALLALVAGLYAFLSRPPTPPAVERKQPPAAADLPAARSDSYGDMVLVAEGKFLYGANNAEHELPAFYIDKTEVTTTMWNQFAQTSGRAAKRQGSDLPVTDVTYDEATAYCAWAQKRLPTGEEWEKAARGKDGFKFPWGNSEDPSKANVNGNPSLPADTLQPAASMPDGASPYGALHMAGNAWEWVRQQGAPSEAVRSAVAKRMKDAGFAPLTQDDVWFAVRGGGIDFGIEGTVSWEFALVPGRFKSPAIGFRCASDPAR